MGAGLDASDHRASLHVAALISDDILAVWRLATVALKEPARTETKTQVLRPPVATSLSVLVGSEVLFVGGAKATVDPALGN